MRVRANAETPADARAARSFGAEGIGLCRTEHMFFDADRIVAVREMILADDEAGAARRRSPSSCRCSGPTSSSCSRSWTGLPVTIRLLDPPLHEFLPKTDAEIAEVAKAMSVEPDKLRERAAGAARVQPDARPSRLPPRHLLSRDRRDAGARHLRGGDRGRARRPASRSLPEIMVPLVATKAELDLRQGADRARPPSVVASETGKRPDYLVGTMIELPRAALARRQDRRGRGVLLLRHQRPDPDHLRHLARRRRLVPRRLHGEAASSPAIRSSRSTSTASANWSRSPSSAAARRGPTSSSASAASMAATRRRSPSARRSGSTTSPARPSACRSPGSRRRRPRSARRAGRAGRGRRSRRPRR